LAAWGEFDIKVPHNLSSCKHLGAQEGSVTAALGKKCLCAFPHISDTPMETIDSIFARYRALGQTVEGDLVLASSIAIRLADELGRAAIPILGIAVWYADPRPEEQYGVDLSHLEADLAAVAAKEFISRWLRDDKHLFSLVTA
jgi:hypothetical protein